MKLVKEKFLKQELSNLFNTRSSKFITARSELKKFNSIWKIVDNFDPDHAFDTPLELQLRRFLSLEGDCKNFKYILACIFFQCHTDSSIAYIEMSVGKNKNLQGRKPIHFAFDLVCGWIFELFLFNNFGVQKSGCDADYILQKGKSINSGADFILGNQSIELSADNYGVSCEKDHLHLRYNKWDKILAEEMYLFVLCPNHSKYYLYHTHYLNEHLNIEWLDRIPAFSKNKDVPGHKLSGWKNLKAFDLNHSNLQKHFNYIEHGVIE